MTGSALAAASAAGAAAPRAPLLPPRLVQLASRAAQPAAWPALRAFAASSPRGAARGYADFVLGYHELGAARYRQAEQALSLAVRDGFPLRDIAVFYLAQAEYQSGQPRRAISVLGSFVRDYPGSTVLNQAVGLLAWAYLQSGGAGEAVHVLATYPRTFQRADLSLPLAIAYQSSGCPMAAARLYQDLYYAFAATPEAQTASNALRLLKAQLGRRYPPVSDRIRSARADKLFAAGRFRDALDEYVRLLADRPRSPMAWQWILGKARCRLELGRPLQAIQALRSIAPLSPSLNAERLRLLVAAYMDIGDEAGMNRSLDQLRIHDMTSHWYAEALFSVASYYLRKGDARLAGALYGSLAALFPQLPQGEEALWRAAWLTYLQGKPADARIALLDYVRKYPYAFQAAGALYFLGRLAEKQGDPKDARGLYELARRRYGHSYYALESALRLQSLPRERRRSAPANKHPRPFNLRDLARLIPPAHPLRLDPCISPAAEPRLRPYLDLAALGLPGLAAHGLLALSSDSPGRPDLILALSRVEAERGRTDRAMYWMERLVGRYRDAPFEDLPRNIWALLYPRSFWPLVNREARLDHLDPYLVMALIREESGFYAGAVSSADAMGLMQILYRPKSFRRRATEARLKNPWDNIRAGCGYLRELMNRYHGNVALALAAYNAGPTRVDEWLSTFPFRTSQAFIEAIPFPGTRIYVQEIFRDRILYRRLMTGKVKYLSCPPR